MFVLHQNSPGVHVDDADGVPSTGGHQTGSLGGVIGVWLEHNLTFHFKFKTPHERILDLTSQIWV